MPDLEERTLETLPPTCASCGTTLTDSEKRLALETGASPVLCTTCATEAEPAIAPGEETEPEP